MQRKAAVLYWQGIVDPHNLNAKYSEQIKRLLAGEYAELNLEKLRGCDVYSIRINKADRLLLTSVETDGVNHLLILEEVLNHDYHRARMLQPKALEKYLELNAPDFANHTITNEDFEKAEKLKIAPDAQELGNLDPEYISAKYYQFRYLNYSVTQEEIVSNPRLQFPMVITGAAGTGKTCVIISLMSRLAAEGNLPLAYVCESTELCTMAKAAWDELPIASKCSENEVAFLTYDQLLKSDAKVVDKDRFMSFLKEQIKHKRKALKAKPDEAFTDKFFNDLKTIYQECRIISGFHEAEIKYKKLGAKQSHYSAESIRTWLLQLCKDYLASLNENEIDPSFVPFTTKPTYNTIFVDEAQDFSLIQLLNLCQLAEGNRVCYGEDPRQSLQDIIAKSTLFSVLFDGKQTKYELIDSYRCPPAIAKVANAVLRMRDIAAGLRFQGIEENIHLKRQCVVTVHDNLSDDVCAAIRERAQSVKLAVITTEEHRKTAIKHFGTQIVLTVKQIKGLEYEEIVCFRLVKSYHLADANKLIERWRKKQNFVSNDEHTIDFNRLFTAVTRARSCLTIVEDDAHSVAAIVAVIKDATIVTAKNVSKPSLTPMKVEVSDSAALSKEADKQIKLGNHVVAKGIYLENLKKTVTELAARYKQLGVELPPEFLAEPKTKVTNPTKKKSSIAKQSVFQEKIRDTKDLNALVGKPSDAELDALFALPADELATTLLRTPLPKFPNMNLLTHLCFNANTRSKVVAHYLPKCFEQLAPHFNPVNFSGGNSANSTTVRAAVIHAIGLAREAVVPLMKLPCFSPTFTANATLVALFGTIRHNNVSLTSVIHFLSLYEDMLPLFIDCLQNIKGIFKALEKDDYLLNALSGDRTDERRSIFTNLLLHGSIGWKALNTILNNTNLTAKISLPLLFVFNSEMDAIRLEKMKKDSEGSLLLKRIMENGKKPQPYNEITTSRDNFSKMSQHLRMLRIVGKGQDGLESNIMDSIKIIATSNNTKVIHELIDGIFNAAPNLRDGYLFGVPLTKYGHECFFTLLFDLPLSREYMLGTILPKYGYSLSRSVTSTALCRTMVTACREATTSARKVPPLLWLACDPALLNMASNWIESDGVYAMMRIEALFIPFAPEYFKNQKSDKYSCYRSSYFRPCTNVNATVLHVLALTNQGMDILMLLSMAHEFTPYLTANMLFEKSILDVTANKAITLIERFCQLKPTVMVNIFIKSPALLAEVMNDDYLGTNPTLLFTLLAINKFDQCLLDALHDTDPSHQLAFTKALLYPLTQEADDNCAAVEVFAESLVHSSAYIEVVTKLLERNPEAIDVLDKRLFTPSEENTSYINEVCPNKAYAMKTLLDEGNPQIENFLEITLALIEERLSRERTVLKIC